jgi:tetratricopeptide (TPR) repeat protein
VTRPTAFGWASPAIVLATLTLAACQGERPAPPSQDPASTASSTPESAGIAAPNTAASGTFAPTKRVLPANTIDVHGVKSATLAPTQLGPEGPMTARSTSAGIYLRNLKSRKISIGKRLAKSPTGSSALSQLAGWHMEQQLLDGDPTHADKALAALDKAIASTPDSRALRLRRAGVLGHLHRFADAQVDVEFALKGDPTNPTARRALGKVLQNRGKYAEAKPHLAVAPSRPTYRDLGERAGNLFKDGKVDRADHTLRIAAATYRDVHPIPLAWIDLQRGLLRLRTGRWAEAKPFFETAYNRLPTYYLVAEHLAEVEAKLGNHTRALELYDAVVSQTHLPEFMAARAGVLADMGRKADAEAALTEADARWDALMVAHGSAYAAHAIGFWLDDRPNPAKARKWADANLKLRRDAESLVMAARAYAATGDKVGARAMLEEALPNGPNVDEFHVDVADVYRAIGEETKAAAAIARAKALNPKAL